jgi:hypothetical protein
MTTEGVRVPTSVLLAVLAAAGLLALAPALVRRYDATERLAAERAQSTARVLDRRRRQRTVPGPRPRYGPRVTLDASPVPTQASPPIGEPVWVSVPRRRPVAPSRRPAAASGRRPVAASRRTPQRPAIYRRRRVLASLVVLNAVELVGVFVLGPGFWTGFAVTMTLLFAYLVHLRNEALESARRHRRAARRAAVVAAVQAEIREEHARRLAARRDALRRAAAARAAAHREAKRLSQRYVDFDPARGARPRGTGHRASGG